MSSNAHPTSLMNDDTIKITNYNYDRTKSVTDDDSVNLINFNSKHLEDDTPYTVSSNKGNKNKKVFNGFPNSTDEVPVLLTDDVSYKKSDFDPEIEKIKKSSDEFASTRANKTEKTRSTCPTYDDSENDIKNLFEEATVSSHIKNMDTTDDYPCQLLSSNKKTLKNDTKAYKDETIFSILDSDLFKDPSDKPYIPTVTLFGKKGDQMFVKLKCPLAKNGTLSLLVDSGSVPSLVKAEALHDETLCYPHLKVNLIGIAGSRFSAGACFLPLQFGRKVISTQFQIITGDQPPYDGILGQNIIRNSVLDYVKRKLTYLEEEPSDKLTITERTFHLNETNPPTTELLSNDIWENANKPFPIKDSWPNSTKAGGHSTTPNTNDKDEVKAFLKKLEIPSVKSFLINNSPPLDKTRDPKGSRISQIMSLFKHDHLTSEQLETVTKLIDDYNKVFILPQDKLPATTAMELNIPLTTDKPIFTKQYKLPKSHEEAVMKQALKWLDEGVVRNSVSNYNNPVLCVEKKTLNTDGSKKLREGRVLRWRLKLARFSFKVIYIKGTANAVADTLSRLSEDDFFDEETSCEPISKVPIYMVTTRANRKLLNTSKDMTDPFEIATKLAQETNQLELDDEEEENLQDEDIKNIGEKLLSPSDGAKTIKDKKLQAELIKLYHEHPLAGHIGIKRGIKKLSDKFFWRGMFQQYSDFVRRCEICQRCKHKNRNPPVPLGTLNPTPISISEIFFDITGPFSPSGEEGFVYILSAQCALTRFAISRPIVNKDTNTVAKVLFEEIFLVFGFPHTLISDQAKEFTSDVINKLMRLVKIKKGQCSIYRANSNIVERYQGTLKTYLTCFLANDKIKSNWSEFVKLAVYVFNSSPHSRTGYAPFTLLFGHITHDVLSELNLPPIYSYNNYYDDLRHKIKLMNEVHRDKTLRSILKDKESHDEGSKEKTFFPGERVLVRKFVRKPLDPPFDQVVVVNDMSTQNVKVMRNNKEQTIHKDHINKLTS